ncbi:hypothetical protein THAOC_10312, partial [Thalassiosira oceanica]
TGADLDAAREDTEVRLGSVRRRAIRRALHRHASFASAEGSVSIMSQLVDVNRPGAVASWLEDEDMPSPLRVTVSPFGPNLTPPRASK